MCVCRSLPASFFPSLIHRRAHTQATQSTLRGEQRRRRGLSLSLPPSLPPSHSLSLSLPLALALALLLSRLLACSRSPALSQSFNPCLPISLSLYPPPLCSPFPPTPPPPAQLCPFATACSSRTLSLSLSLFPSSLFPPDKSRCMDDSIKERPGRRPRSQPPPPPPPHTHTPPPPPPLFLCQMVMAAYALDASIHTRNMCVHPHTHEVCASMHMDTRVYVHAHTHEVCAFVSTKPV